MNFTANNNHDGKNITFHMKKCRIYEISRIYLKAKRISLRERFDHFIHFEDLHEKSNYDDE